MKQGKKTIAEQEAELKASLNALRKNRREREVLEALDAGWVAQGVRLVPPKGADEGCTFPLTASEAATLNDALRKIAEARLSEAA